MRWKVGSVTPVKSVKIRASDSEAPGCREERPGFGRPRLAFWA